MEVLPERFELDGYIDEAMECLERIHLSFVCIVLPEVKQAAAYVEDLAQEVAGGGRPCIYLMHTPEHMVEGQASPCTMNTSWMPVEVAQFITQLPPPHVLSQGRSISINM